MIYEPWFCDFFYVFVFTALLVLYFVLLSEWPAIGTFLPWIWFECLNCGLESKVFSVLMCSKDEKHSFVICLCVLSDGFLFLLKFGFCFKKIPVMSAFLLWIWYLLIGMIGLSIKIWSFFLGIKLGWENMVDSSNHCGLQSWFCEKNLPFLVNFFFKNVLFEGNTCYVCLWAVDLMLAYMTAWITDKNQGLRVRVDIYSGWKALLKNLIHVIYTLDFVTCMLFDFGRTMHLGHISIGTKWRGKEQNTL